MADRKASKGHPEGHTRGDGGAAAADQALPGRDLEDLLAGSPDLDAGDVLAVAAELSSRERRARGRPAGSGNRKNADHIAYLAALGHRDPWTTLSLIQTADHGALCKALKADTPKLRVQVLNIQKAAAADLMPYHHSKRPQPVEQPDAPMRPVLLIGEMNVQQLSLDGYMSAAEPPMKVVDNQGLGDSAAVRQDACDKEDG